MVLEESGKMAAEYARVCIYNAARCEAFVQRFLMAGYDWCGQEPKHMATAWRNV